MLLPLICCFILGAILWKYGTDLTQTKKAVGNWLADTPWKGGEISKPEESKKKALKKKDG
jgi:hypothetical protein